MIEFKSKFHIKILSIFFNLNYNYLIYKAYCFKTYKEVSYIKYLIQTIVHILENENLNEQNSY